MKRWAFIGFGLICAVLLSQFPAFHQQYLQRLGGHVDELARSVAALDERAMAMDLDRYAYTRRLAENEDPVVAGEGMALMDTIARYVGLSASLKRLSTLPMYLLAGAMVVEIDGQIGSATLAAFQPALPFSLAGLGYAAAGFFIGYLGSMGLAMLLFRRRVPVKPEGEL